MCMSPVCLVVCRSLWVCLCVGRWSVRCLTVWSPVCVRQAGAHEALGRARLLTGLSLLLLAGSAAVAGQSSRPRGIRTANGR